MEKQSAGRPTILRNPVRTTLSLERDVMLKLRERHGSQWQIVVRRLIDAYFAANDDVANDDE